MRSAGKCSPLCIRHLNSGCVVRRTCESTCWSHWLAETSGNNGKGQLHVHLLSSSHGRPWLDWTHHRKGGTLSFLVTTVILYGFHAIETVCSLDHVACPRKAGNLPERAEGVEMRVKTYVYQQNKKCAHRGNKNVICCLTYRVDQSSKIHSTYFSNLLRKHSK